MAFGPSDIRFFFSGGLTNNNPDNSLGGDISVFWITNTRLFADISAAESEIGKTDYRCIYVNNISEELSSVLFDAGFFIENQVIGGANISVGTIIANERQDIVITNGTLVSGGNFILRYFNLLTEEWTNFQVDWASSINNWATNFELSIRNIPGLESVKITPVISGTTITFQVEYLGKAANRYHESLELVSASVDFSFVSSTITPIKISSGGPIMLVADEISSDVIPPNGIVFNEPTITNPIMVSDLKPGEFFPIWIRRELFSNSTAIENDGFRIKLRGEIATS